MRLTDVRSINPEINILYNTPASVQVDIVLYSSVLHTMMYIIQYNTVHCSAMQRYAVQGMNAVRCSAVPVMPCRTIHYYSLS